VSLLGKSAEMLAWIAVMCLVVRPLGRYRPRAGVTRAEKALLTEGFECLGSQRVAVGLRATGHEWHDCFLAAAAADDGRPASWVARIRGWGRLPGLRNAVTRTLAGVWDRDEDAFRDLASAWLEESRSSRPRNTSDPVPAARRLLSGNAARDSASTPTRAAMHCG
jgi:hypothetical protein